jgi:hypothetical protein
MSSDVPGSASAPAPRAGTFARLPLHPFFAACFVVFSFRSSNAHYVDFANVAPVLLAMLALAASLVALGAAVTGRLAAAGVVALAWIAWLFGYEGATELAAGRIRPRYFVAVYGLLGIAVAIAARRWRDRLGGATRPLNITLGFVLAVPLATGAWELARERLGRQKTPFPGRIFPETVALKPPAQEAPDIYFMVLDEYGRADQLKRIFDLDNEPFLEALRSRGFFVAQESRTNYFLTLHSLTSTLNLDYLDRAAEVVGEESRTIKYLASSLQDSVLRRSLSTLGYQTVAFDTGYRWANLADADFYHRYLRFVPGDEFSRNILEMTPLGVVAMRAELAARESEDGDREPWVAVNRLKVQSVFRRLPEIAALPGPQFVLAHVISPHPPFVLAREGRNPAQNLKESERQMAELTGQGRRSPSFLLGYKPQVEALNDLVLQAVDDILRHSTVPPVIVIEGDHGSGSLHHPTDPARTDLDERAGILAAVFFPDRDYRSVPNDLAAVNTFRIVLNTYFDAKLPLLPSRTFFSTYDRPYRYTEVTDRLGQPGKAGTATAPR